MGIPKGEESEQGIKDLSEEIMAKNFSNLVKEKDTQVQEAQTIPNKLDTERPTPRPIIIKMAGLRQGENPKSPKRKTGSSLPGSSN